LQYGRAQAVDGGRGLAVMVCLKKYRKRLAKPAQRKRRNSHYRQIPGSAQFATGKFGLVDGMLGLFTAFKAEIR